MGIVARIIAGGGSPLGIFPLWLWIILGMALAMVAQEGVRRVQVAGLEVQVAQSREALATAQKTAATRARQEEATQRAIENQRARDAQENANAIRNEERRTADALARARAADGRVRDAVRSFLARGGQASGDPAAAARAGERAEAVGRVLETCRREATEDAGELEGLATQVRGLQRAYRSIEKEDRHGQDAAARDPADAASERPD